MDWTLGKALCYVEHDGPIKCPMKKGFLLSFNNLSLNKNFPVVPLLPSGQYRIDVTFTEAKRNNIYASWQLYFEISDNRLEQY